MPTEGTRPVRSGAAQGRAAGKHVESGEEQARASGTAGGAEAGATPNIDAGGPPQQTSRVPESGTFNRFMQVYAAEKCPLEARKKGFSVGEQGLQDGSVKLQILEGVGGRTLNPNPQ